MTEILEMDATSTRFNLPTGSLEGLTTVAQEAPCMPLFGLVHQHLVNAFKSSGPRG